VTKLLPLALIAFPLFAFVTSASGDAQQRPTGCSAHLRAEVDRPAFRQNGVNLTDRQAEQFRARAFVAFRDAADRLCSARQLRRQDLARYTTLRLVPGSGADSATFFDDPSQWGRATLAFQYAGFEDGLTLPARSDIQMGLRCWFNPRLAGCADRMP
jgi:hypothetical protein